jgi:disease resistance protein RPM1
LQIQFGPFEFLVEISGTTGPYVCAENDVVTSLMLVTNVRSYGPYGSGGGTPFSTSVQANGSIVGFFGRSGRFLNAIGVYVNPNRLALAELETAEDVLNTSFHS